jgi:hypothetical protein
MAKVLFSALVSDVRKKIGSTVFAKSRTGAYVRKKVSPTQPRTAAQRAVRANFTTNSKDWPGTLTATQRAGWNSLAASLVFKDRFGQSFKPTGLQLYQRANRNLSTISVASISDAPSSFSVGSPGTATLTATSGGTPAMSVAITGTPVTNEVPVVWAAPPISKGRTFVGKKYTYLFKAAAATAGPYNILSAYIAKYGALVSGDNYNVEVSFINNLTGAQSGKISAQAFAT